MSSPQPNEDKLERLAEAMRNAEQNGSVFVPPTVDEAILRQARERFEGNAKRPSFRFWNWMALAGAAASIAILILIFLRIKPAATARQDINGDGQVDILDAFALAKSMEGGKGADQNGDGKLDDTDIQAIASAAVRLDRKS